MNMERGSSRPSRPRDTNSPQKRSTKQRQGATPNRTGIVRHPSNIYNDEGSLSSTDFAIDRQDSDEISNCDGIATNRAIQAVVQPPSIESVAGPDADVGMCIPCNLNEQQEVDRSVPNGIPREIEADEPAPELSPSHFLVATMAGPTCTKCVIPMGGQQVATRLNQSDLFFCSKDALSNHLKKNGCYQGDLKKISMRGLEKSLVGDMRALHDAAARTSSAHRDFEPTGDTAYCCKRCGKYHATRKGVLRHYKSKGRGNKCNSSHRPYLSDSPVRLMRLKGTNFVVPETVLQQINDGKSPLSTLSDKISMPSASPRPSMPAVPSVTPRSTDARSSAPTPAIVASHRDKTIVTPASELDRVYSPSFRHERNKFTKELEEALATFDAQNSNDHSSTFSKVADDGNGKLRDLNAYLKEGARHAEKDYDQLVDEPALFVFHRAVELWLESGSANNDLNHHIAHIRSIAYTIGDAAKECDDLVNSNTVVATSDVGPLIDECKRLISFLYRRKWPKIQAARASVQDAIDRSRQNVKDDFLEDAASRVSETSLVMDVLVNALLDEPKVAYQPNVIEEYVAIRTVKLVGEKEEVVIRGANAISRAMSYTLKVLRHGIFSHCARWAQYWESSRSDGCSHKDSSIYNVGLIRSINGSSEKDYELGSGVSIAAISTRIRSAKAIQAKSPSALNKLVDLNTGNMYIGGAEVSRNKWSRIIPESSRIAKEDLKSLFTSYGVLDEILDVGNDLVYHGDDSYVIIRSEDGATRRVYFRSLIPDLSKSDANSKLSHLHAFEQFALAYCGLGACRGTEVERIHKFDAESATVAFGHLVYETLSRKGERHGSNKNKKVQHFLSESHTRIVLLINLCLYPKVAESELEMPTKNQAYDSIHLYMQEVLDLDRTLGLKNSRQLMASISNYLFPSGESIQTTNPVVAKTFGHGRVIHDNSYSSDVAIRLSSGDLVSGWMVYARLMHTGIGEPRETSCTVGRPPLSEANLNDACEALYGNGASMHERQKEVIMKMIDKSYQFHTFINIECGGGKSGAYIIPAMAALLDGRPPLKSLVITPHNVLLSQQDQQAKQFFGGFNGYKISVIDSDDLSSDSLPEDIGNFNIAFISIHSLMILIKDHWEKLKAWGIDLIFWDEIHTAIQELGLRQEPYSEVKKITALGAKMALMSATLTDGMVECFSNLLGIEKAHQVVEGSSTLPRLALLHRQELDDEKMKMFIVDEALDLMQKERNACVQIYALSKDDCRDFKRRLESNGFGCHSVTSDETREEKEEAMLRWNSGMGSERVLVSTVVAGIDSSRTKLVFHAGMPRSIVEVVQWVGRIRKSGQGPNAKAYICTSQRPRHSGPSYGEQDLEDDIDVLESNRFVPNGKREMIADLYRTLFTQLGVQSWFAERGCMLNSLFRKVLALGQVGQAARGCGICSSCIKMNPVALAAFQSQERIRTQRLLEVRVTERLRELERRCFICKVTECDGSNCCVGYNKCRRCYSEGHISSQCALKKSVMKDGKYVSVVTEANQAGLCCIYCFGFIRRGGTHGKVGPGVKCVWKDRVKHVLLFGNDMNYGGEKFRRLKKVFSSKEEWYRVIDQKMDEVEAYYSRRERPTPWLF